MKTRKLDVAVISDLHLATYACKAKSILKYLKSIDPSKLILNGDIIDSWRFSRSYFPKQHLKVIRQIIKMMEKGVKVIYITGNHDEFLRKFNLTEIGNLKIVNHYVLDLDGSKTYLVHGDIFDSIIHNAKWLARLGAAVYGFLTLIAKGINFIIHLFGLKPVVVFKFIKKHLTWKRQHLSKFEQGIVRLVAGRNCSTIICGHTHVPNDKQIMVGNTNVRYLNCGDWVEHLTACEYFDGNWHLHYFIDDGNELMLEEPYIPNKLETYQSLYNELFVAFR